MANEVILVLDCGATNVRAIAVDTAGRIVAKSVQANATQPADENPAWHVWPIDEILGKFAQCCAAIRPTLESSGQHVAGITVTTFGVDGALVSRATGEMVYPVISWKCPRTIAVMEAIGRYVDPVELQHITGVGRFSFNTIYKLVWLKENRPELLHAGNAWLFISSLIAQRLTGALSTDRTMAGTSQLFDLQKDAFSETILERIGISPTLFPPLVNPGETIGRLHAEAARLLGLEPGIPVISAGHDTQFALFGSGAGADQPVLSSGTWEILMVRASHVDTVPLAGIPASTCELDSSPGYYNPGLQWLASAVLEWVRNTCWRGVEGNAVYDQMIAEAEAIAAGCNGVRMRPDMLLGSGGQGNGAYEGLSIDTTRGHLYRAALEALAGRLAEQLKRLETICHFSAKELILVGGGSKNRLWNQLKADALRLPVRVIAENEITVLGAALYALAGLGYYPTPDAARAAVRYEFEVYEPR